MKRLKLALGADHRGIEAMQHVAQRLTDLNCDVEVFTCPAGESCDYPDNAWRVGKAVSEGRADKGILLCGTGIGMCMAANKIKGVRAAVVQDELAAEMSRSHNDANVLCLPADMLGLRLIDKITDRWLKTAFDGGRHARRVHKITAIENGQNPTGVKD